MDTRRIGAIGITHQRKSFVGVNEDDHPIRPARPAILWLDSRSREQVACYGSDEVHRITGKPPNPAPGFYRMMWLRETEPGTLERAAKVGRTRLRRLRHDRLLAHLVGDRRPYGPGNVYDGARRQRADPLPTAP